MNWLLRFLINALVLYLIAKYVPGFNHDVTVWTAVIAAIIFGLVNAIIGPILRLISFPLTVLTFGLFSIVVNYILFALTVWITPNFAPLQTPSATICPAGEIRCLTTPLPPRKSFVPWSRGCRFSTVRSRRSCNRIRARCERSIRKPS